MAGRLLLDTNIVIDLIEGRESVRRLVQSSQEVFIPVIALGELYYGAFRSRRVGENLKKLEELAAERSIIFCNADTARHYGAIKGKLRTIGNPIPDNDVWIAAVALQHSLTIVTRDHHFQVIDGLQTISD